MKRVFVFGGVAAAGVVAALVVVAGVLAVGVVAVLVVAAPSFIVGVSGFNPNTAYALQTGNSAWFEDEGGVGGDDKVGGGSEAGSEESDRDTKVSVDDSVDENAKLPGGNAESSSSKIFIETEGLDHDILKVSVKCERLETPVLGIAFHLNYDSGLMSFLRYDPGDFLEKGGDPFYIVSAEKNENSAEVGEIVFGETLRRNDSFPVGNGTVAELYFQKMGKLIGDELPNGELPLFELNFKNGVVSTMDTTRQDLDTVNFVDFKYGEKMGLQDEETLPAKEATYQANVSGSFNDFSIIFVIASGVAFGAAVIFLLKYKKIKAKI